MANSNSVSDEKSAVENGGDFSVHVFSSAEEARGMAENKQLEKQVCGLRGELKLAQEMLFASRLAQADQAQPQVNQAWIPPVSSLSSCCDEGVRSSSLNDDVVWSGNWASAADQANLQYEELYACLMMNGKGSNEWNHVV